MSLLYEHRFDLLSGNWHMFQHFDLLLHAGVVQDSWGESGLGSRKNHLDTCESMGTTVDLLSHTQEVEYFDFFFFFFFFGGGGGWGIPR